MTKTRNRNFAKSFYGEAAPSLRQNFAQRRQTPEIGDIYGVKFPKTGQTLAETPAQHCVIVGLYYSDYDEKNRHNPVKAVDVMRIFKGVQGRLPQANVVLDRKDLWATVGDNRPCQIATDVVTTFPLEHVQETRFCKIEPALIPDLLLRRVDTAYHERDVLLWNRQINVSSMIRKGFSFSGLEREHIASHRKDMPETFPFRKRIEPAELFVEFGDGERAVFDQKTVDTIAGQAVTMHDDLPPPMMWDVWTDVEPSEFQPKAQRPGSPNLLKQRHGR